MTTTKDSPKCPGFSRKLAKKHGVAEAVVLRFIAHKVRQAITAKRNLHRDKFWYYESIRNLTENQLPWFAPATLADILTRLKKKGLIEVGRFNKWHVDRTAWYSMPQAALDAAEEDVIYFDEIVAIEFGFCEAVLIENVRFLLRERDGFPGFFPVKVSPTNLAKLLPFSESTIRRALEQLVEAQLLKQDEESTNYYTLKQPSEFKVGENGRILPVKKVASNPDITLSNPDNSLSKPDMSLSKADDNTH